MLILFLVGVLALDVSQCVRGKSLVLIPVGVVPGGLNWTQLAPVGGLYHNSTFNFTAASITMRLMVATDPALFLTAFEYILPNHSAGSISVYQLNYTFAQAGYINSSFLRGIGPWHIAGLDWGERGSSPIMPAIRYSSGSN